MASVTSSARSNQLWVQVAPLVTGTITDAARLLTDPNTFLLDGELWVTPGRGALVHNLEHRGAPAAENHTRQCGVPLVTRDVEVQLLNALAAGAIVVAYSNPHRWVSSGLSSPGRVASAHRFFSTQHCGAVRVTPRWKELSVTTLAIEGEVRLKSLTPDRPGEAHPGLLW
jgi:hypothetical protein